MCMHDCSAQLELEFENKLKAKGHTKDEQK